MKSLENITDWSSDMPGCTLPFYVWLASRKLSRREVKEEAFEPIYLDFLSTMGWEETEDFRYWCKRQFAHYYESN